MTYSTPRIQSRRADLPIRLNQLAAQEIVRLNSFRSVELFLNAATNEAAYGEGYTFFGRMRAAGEALPSEFETIDPANGLKGPDQRVVPFIRSNQFVALVASLEDYLSQVLETVFLAEPSRLDPMLAELLAADPELTLDAAVESAAVKRCHKLFYKSPLQYGHAIERHLGMEPVPEDFQAVWPEFVEMKARRDLGVHANWRKNSLYVKKVEEVGGPIYPSDFLAIDAAYFETAVAKGYRIVAVIKSHCASAFAPLEIKVENAVNVCPLK